MRGKLIVIEGVDGTGKETQTKMLIERLKREGYENIKYIDFPRYGKPSAWAVEQYLNSKLGSLKEINPRISSIFFAFDRFCACDEIKEALQQGRFVVANRYTSSNMGHQAAQVRDKEQRDEFLAWLENLEYKVYRLPKPDKIILLKMNPGIAQRLVAERKKKDYVTGDPKDLLERDVEHLRAAQETYLYVAKKYNWEIVDCSPKGNLRTPEDIHKEIWNIVQKLL
jgi:dTMP kinase